MSLIGFEFLDLHLDLLHAVLVELFPVSKEEEDLQDHKERRRDEGLVPGIKQRRGPPLKHTMSNKLGSQNNFLKCQYLLIIHLNNPHDHIKGEESLPQRVTLDWSVGCCEIWKKYRFYKITKF